VKSWCYTAGNVSAQSITIREDVSCEEKMCIPAQRTVVASAGGDEGGVENAYTIYGCQ